MIPSWGKNFFFQFMEEMEIFIYKIFCTGILGNFIIYHIQYQVFVLRKYIG
ncbi:hypothetical protein M080_3311 [Bacteroides fragilis str. 3397 T10]|nr:hypothetical protein M080_3311 [Bacteroides fragilis str. 3397 T10]